MRLFTPLHCLLPTVAAVGLALGGTARPAAAAGDALEPRSQVADTLTGTCLSIDAAAGTFRLITGVSHALKVVTLRVDQQSRITMEGRPARLDELGAGLVLHIEYQRTPAGNRVQRLEARRMSEGGGT